MSIGTFITLGLGSSGGGNLAASIPKIILTGLISSAAVAVAAEEGTWYPVLKATRAIR